MKEELLYEKFNGEYYKKVPNDDILAEHEKVLNDLREKQEEYAKWQVLSDSARQGYIDQIAQLQTQLDKLEIAVPELKSIILN